MKAPLRTAPGTSYCRIGSIIFQVNYLSVQQNPPDNGVASGRERQPAHKRVSLRFVAEGCRHPICLPVTGDDMGRLRDAKPRGGFDQRVKHRLQIEGRAADDLQHVAGRGLVFQRFLKIGRAGLQRAISLGAADGDHRLLGEGFQQFDLAVGEAARRGATDGRWRRCGSRRAATEPPITERCQALVPLWAKPRIGLVIRRPGPIVASELRARRRTPATLAVGMPLRIRWRRLRQSCRTSHCSRR